MSVSPEETFRGDEWVFVVYFLLVLGMVSFEFEAVWVS